MSHHESQVLVSQCRRDDPGGHVTIRCLREHDCHGWCCGSPNVVDGDPNVRRERYRSDWWPTFQMPWEILYGEAARVFDPWTRNGLAAQ